MVNSFISFMKGLTGNVILSYLVDMAMLIIIRAVTLYYKNVVDREKLLEVTKKEMLIMEYGVCRNTGN